MREFLKNILSSGTPESAKRFSGVIGFIACVFMICVFKRDLLPELLYVSSGLLGLGLLECVKK